MAPIEDTPGPAPLEGVQGSGELELEVAITRMRGSIMRLVSEIDRFTDTVRQAREALEVLKAHVAQEKTS
jgi:hypothetical protein